ncbi:unnamed protein product [Brachionus calyciflorus]|uniref:E1 ubiquitin-activating enzyme n=1 Tax=Brachionus calyciflorus TaxID=104777 RepID=A0A813R4U5_9BILA|nr:unnamed protein product [Brachionus calyciflorus]
MSPNEKTEEETITNIDESLYSRQLYVLGHEAMKKMQNSNILICGMGGLGVEIAKNTILAGVKSVTIYDQKNTSHEDLSSQFYLRESDIGKNRAICSHKYLSELNTYVTVDVFTSNIEWNYFKKFQVVVLTDSFYDEQIKIGNFCHENEIKFICAETRGVFGKIFCDFGKSFRIFDVNGQNRKSSMISCITNDKDGIVTTFEDQRHDLEDGNYVIFSEVKGMSEINNKEFKVKVLSPFSFSVGDTSNFKPYESGGIALEVKKEKIIDFKSYELSSQEPKYMDSDSYWGDEDQRKIDNDTTHLAFQTLDEFRKENSDNLPNPWNLKDAIRFVEIANILNLERKNQFPKLNENLLKIFSLVSRGNLCPIQSVIGGTAAQEIIKACSGKFHPIHQYFYFNCQEVLPENVLEKINYVKYETEGRYSSQINIFGQDFQEKLENLKIFLVGSGALGCEYLKNLAMMGIGSGPNGLITVTDMDTIEKSNLNRQFLFRSWDVNKSKAEVSSRAAKEMNPNLNIRTNLNRVGPETENIYNEEFYNSVDVVCNALDNVKTRLYIDSKCIEFRKPLIESGTLGTEGNVQVCLPFLTEAYSSSQDPPEKNIPICTLKIFPNAIEHTLQWARDMFQGLFTNSAISAQNFLKDPQNYFHNLQKLGIQQRLEELKQLDKIFFEEKCSNIEECIVWARENWEENFNNNIQQLLFNFPSDSLMGNGLPFWTSPKRCPHPLAFSPDNTLHFEYIFTAANLKASLHGIEQVRERQKVYDYVKNVQVQKFIPKTGVRIKVNENDEDEIDFNDENEIERLTNLLNENYENLKNNSSLIPIEFEKDNDENLHMDFITTCSNLRAENYDIAPTDKHNSKLIAGKIIPAIATTTSVIVGLDCIELYKIVQGHQRIEFYRNSYINLALPFFQSSEPMPVTKYKFNNVEWSLWDRIEIKGEMTLKQFLDYFKEEHKLTVTMIGYDVVTIYSNFLSIEKRKDRLNKKITEILEIIKKEKLPEHTKSLTLSIVCYDSNEEDVDIPLIKYTIRN